MKIITTNNTIQPVIDHIKEMQEQVKNLEAELKQYKTLLQEEYMKDAVKIQSQNGRTLAQIISQIRASFNQKKLQVEQPDIYNSYVSEIEVSFLRVS